jgi:hypothetical protein
VSLTGGNIAANGTCTITLNVTGTTAGAKVNSVTVTDTTAGTGNTSTATVTVVVPVNDEAYQIRYAANLDKGESFVDITNVGTLSGTDPAGRICANVYAFDPAEEIISCCACLITPNGLVSLAVNNDIMGNTLTPGRPTSIVIKLLASTPIGGQCNPSAPTADSLVRGMRAWGTTIHNLAGSSASLGITETPFLRAELSPTELQKLTSYCGFIQTVGSGFGQCKSCTTQVGAQGGTLQIDLGPK